MNNARNSFIFCYYLSIIPGNDVPNATKAIAVIVSVRPIVQPNYKNNNIKKK